MWFTTASCNLAHNANNNNNVINDTNIELINKSYGISVGIGRYPNSGIGIVDRCISTADLSLVLAMDWSLGTFVSSMQGGDEIVRKVVLSDPIHPFIGWGKLFSSKFTHFINEFYPVISLFQCNAPLLDSLKLIDCFKQMFRCVCNMCMYLDNLYFLFFVFSIFTVISNRESLAVVRRYFPQYALHSQDVLGNKKSIDKVLALVPDDILFNGIERRELLLWKYCIKSGGFF